MAKSMTFTESLKDRLGLSRRQFVKGMAASCAAAAAVGCSGSDDETLVYAPAAAEPDVNPPSIPEEVYEGASPHNCGGGCLLKAYVANGVIKRFTTDERPEKSYVDTIPGDNPQERVCPRCRGQKGWIYNSNRVTYPLIQTKERGDLTGFKRVSWAEAGAYFKAKLEKVRNTYGPAAFHAMYASGIGGGYDPSGVLWRFVGAGTDTGSYARLTYRDDYSFPEWEHTHRMMHDEVSQPKSNDQEDALNSENLVIWCYNLAEMFNQQQITWMAKQIKEKGVKITVIDQHHSRTALYADDFVAPVHATDSAMMLAMVYLALTKYRTELKALYSRHSAYGTVTTDDDLRKAVGRYIYGFFDSNTADGPSVNNSYTLAPVGTVDLTAEPASKVGPGASFSAYVLGGADQDPCNQGKSIYPDKIGYNARSYQVDGQADPLQGKFTNAYGQVAKTPEWASKICGVSPEKIDELTKMFLTTDVTCWTMGGQQRNSEGEQVCWMYTVLMHFFLCFGKKGRTFGRPYGKGNNSKKESPSLTWSSSISQADYTQFIPDALAAGGTGITDPVVGTIPPYLDSTKIKWSYVLGDTSKVTYPANSNSVASTTNIPVFLWLDAVEATNSPKVADADGTMVWPSRWNDGQVKRLPVPVKFLWHVAGNITINQNGDTNLATSILTKTAASLVDNADVPGVSGVKMNPKGYKLEFIGMCDPVMTPSTRYADLIIPGTMGFERYQGGTSVRSPMTYVTKKVTAPQGDAMCEMEMGAEIAAAFGKRDAYYNGYNKNNGLTFEENVWRESLNSSSNTGKFNGRNFDGWVKDGMFKYYDDLTKLENYICYAGYLANPGTSALASTISAEGDETAAMTRNRKKTAFGTLSGRVEAFCLPMMENYEMRYYNNIDSSADAALKNGGALYTKSTAAGDVTKGRYVYPIPMYIPIVEGRHHDDAAAPHPDPLGLKTDYPCSFHTWHIIYRSHSTFNSSPYTNEVRYHKRDANGNPAHLKRSVTNVNANADANGNSGTVAPQVWMDGVYETVWLNHETAAAYGGIKEGDVIICESPRGKIKVSAHLSQRIRPGVIMIGQGSWYNPENGGAGGAVDKGTVDNGGCANTLFSLRPSRIGQGMTLASDCRIKIYKA